MITYKVVYFEKEYLDNAVQQIDNSTEEIFNNEDDAKNLYDSIDGDANIKHIYTINDNLIEYHTSNLIKLK